MDIENHANYRTILYCAGGTIQCIVGCLAAPPRSLALEYQYLPPPLIMISEISCKISKCIVG